VTLHIHGEPLSTPVKRSSSIGTFIGVILGTAGLVVFLGWASSDQSPRETAPDEPVAAPPEKVKTERSRSATSVRPASRQRPTQRQSVQARDAASTAPTIIETAPDAAVQGVQPNDVASPTAEARNATSHEAAANLSDSGDATTHLLTAYLSGQRAAWMPYAVPAESPLVIRAAGQVSIGAEVSGPNGLSDADAIGRAGTSSNARVLPSAPSLALIGRLCSEKLCSQPFFVGGHAVLCPTDTTTAELQLWTNNDIRIDGIRSFRRYSATVGGFSVSVSSGSNAACRAPQAPQASRISRFQPGQLLRRPDLHVSSSQAWWKPFFIPLDQPLRLRASGTIQAVSHGKVGPNGSPTEPRSSGGESPRVEANLPSQALIGRLCGADECGAPFLVGAERTICPSPPLDDHIELWINHDVDTRRRLGSLPITSDIFELQTHHGEFRFDVVVASDDACRTRTQ
jgi:hypothetical protein